MKVAGWVVTGVAGFGGALVLPVFAYVAGGRLVGPYAGPRGLASYLGSIYADALAGHPLALALVLAPALVVIAWQARAWAHRRAAGAVPPRVSNSTKSST